MCSEKLPRRKGNGSGWASTGTFFSFPILAQRFGDAHPAETPSPLHPATTSNAVPMLTRLPPIRIFASPIRSQSASLLTLGTRVEEEEEKFKARTSNFEFSPPLRRRRHRRPEPLHDTALRVVQTHALRRCPRQRKRPPRPSRIREVGLAAGGVAGCERHYPESGNRNHGLHG
jgi:hypothetical protein